MKETFLLVRNQKIYSDAKGPLFLTAEEIAAFESPSAIYPLMGGVKVVIFQELARIEDFEDQTDLENIEKGFMGLRALLALTNSEQEYELLARAAQIATWHTQHRYCSQCATPMELHKEDLAFECPSCGFSAYPRISPCVIVLVRRGNECLLANAAKFNSKRFSTLAGFIESGETAEAAVAREVEEEVGVKVTNVKYQFSQPWPFPHSLMLGFTADYESGDIVPDGFEILEAGWFTKDNLPEIPPPFTIARRLIDQFLSDDSV